MDIKLLALAGIMAATMGLTACDSKTENAAEDVADAKEEVVDASQELAETDVANPEAEAAVADAAAALDDAAAATATTEIDAEVPVTDGTVVVDAADEVVVVEPAKAQ